MGEGQEGGVGGQGRHRRGRPDITGQTQAQEARPRIPSLDASFCPIHVAAHCQLPPRGLARAYPLQVPISCPGNGPSQEQSLLTPGSPGLPKATSFTVHILAFRGLQPPEVFPPTAGPSAPWAVNPARISGAEATSAQAYGAHFSFVLL